MRGREIICITMLIMASVSLAFATDSPPSYMHLYVFTDGLVEINYKVLIDATVLSIFLELPGSPFHSVLILNQDVLPLDFTLNSTGAIIETIGSTCLDIFYYSSSLTSKLENIWTLNLTAPIPCKIILPADSMIVGLNKIPLEIGTENNNPYIISDSGAISVSYIQGIIDQRSLAEDVILEAQLHLHEYKNQKLIIPNPEILLSQAQEYYNQGNYSEAIDLAHEAIQEAENIAEIASEASDIILEASIAIQNAKEEYRTQNLEEADTLLSQANTAYNNGDYIDASSFAYQSQFLAESSEKPKSILPLLIGVSILLLFGVTFIFTSWVRGKKPRMTPINTDLERIFKENPNLRVDDKEVIRYISDNKGELFANEIRERFEIPRTSFWRMTQRLTAQEILEERKVGGQSLLSINRRYRK